MNHFLRFLVLLVIATAAGCDDGSFNLTPTIDEQSFSGIFIPKNLHEAHVELDKMLPEQIRNKLRKDTSFKWKLHMSLGMWLRNNWGLWKGSAISDWFTLRGIQHPDNMSGAILSSYALHLSGSKNFDDVIATYAKWDLDLHISSKAQKMADMKIDETFGERAAKFNRRVHSGQPPEDDRQVMRVECLEGTTLVAEITISYRLDENDPDIRIDVSPISLDQRPMSPP